MQQPRSTDVCSECCFMFMLKPQHDMKMSQSKNVECWHEPQQFMSLRNTDSTCFFSHQSLHQYVSWSETCHTITDRRPAIRPTSSCNLLRRAKRWSRMCTHAYESPIWLWWDRVSSQGGAWGRVWQISQGLLPRHWVSIFDGAACHPIMKSLSSDLAPRTGRGADMAHHSY